MNFWFSYFDNYINIPDNFLCVSITKNVPIYFNRKNAIIPYRGIFDIPIVLLEEKFEDNYFISINNEMRKKGFNGFIDYLNKLDTFFKNEIFHNDEDKIIHYDNIVFMYNKEEEKYIKLLIKLFNNFNIQINKFKMNILNNNLF